MSGNLELSTPRRQPSIMDPTRPAGVSIPPAPVDYLARGRPEDMIALMTTGLVLLPLVAMGVVLAWAESRARRRESTVVEPRLTSALLAARDDEGLRQDAFMALRERGGVPMKASPC